MIDNDLMGTKAKQKIKTAFIFRYLPLFCFLYIDLYIS